VSGVAASVVRLWLVIGMLWTDTWLYIWWLVAAAATDVTVPVAAVVIA
jgi:hypothetical protein